MSISSDLMEIKEEQIRETYKLAEAMLDGFDHTPRIAEKREAEPVKERSSGIGTRRRFRSTTPGLVTRSTARPEGVQLAARIASSDDDDPLLSPLQATVLHAIRRALAVAQVVGDQYAEQTGLADMMRDNLAGTLEKARHSQFSDLLAASALISLHVFANMTDFLLSSANAEAGDQEIDIG
ncbi:MAG: hypothetical protein MI923_22040, partial [Phycisphaerales bacterium]|nr:hypothetical protein [Phycisphaerales bacterium]